MGGPGQTGLRRGRAAALSPSTLAVRVYYEDTDASGIVYHASYLRFFERGRTESLRALGETHRELAAASGLAFVVRAMTIDFLQPARLDDLLVVETVVEVVGGASIDFSQRALLDGRLLVSASVRVAALRDGRAARLPPGLRAAMTGAAGPAHTQAEVGPVDFPPQRS